MAGNGTVARLVKILAFVSAVAAAGVGALAPASYLTPEDRQRMQAMFLHNLVRSEAVSSAYAALGLQLLSDAPGSGVPDAEGLCARLQTSANAPGATVASIYQAAFAASGLTPKCKLTLNAASSSVRLNANKSSLKLR